MAQLAGMAVVAVAAAPSASFNMLAAVLHYSLEATTLAISTLRSLAPEFTSDPTVRAELAALDVDAKLATVQALVASLAARKTEEDEVMRVCVTNVSECVAQLNTTLEAIKTELATHQTRYLSSWRSPNTAEHLVQLRLLMGVLDKRVDLLLKVKDFMKTA